MPEPATRSVVIERELPHPPEKIWRALTEGALIERWLMKNDFRPIVGHRFQFRADPTPHWSGVIDGEVLAVEPHRRLAYRWSSPDVAKADWPDTVVTWTLSPAEGGTLVRMEQSGFPPEGERFYTGATYGWQKFLGELERVLAGLD